LVSSSAYNVLARAHQASGENEEAEHCIKIAEKFDQMAKEHHQ